MTQLKGLIFSLVLLFSCPIMAIETHLDKTQINQDETVILTLRVDGQVQLDPLDLSALKTDFDVISQSQRSQIQIINAQKSTYTDWLIGLAPKRTGQLTIPAIKVGMQKSEVLTLTVRTAKQQRQAGQSPDVFITLSSDDKEVYVQAQLTLVLRLHYRNLQGGQLTDPEPKNATVLRLGKDKSKTIDIKGETYQVLERRYAIFAENSGTLTIPPLLFEGKIKNTQTRSRSAFDNLGFFGINNRLKTIRVRSETFKIQVKPQAATFNAKHWLPAQDLQIFSKWQTDKPIFKVGEPITRSFTLQAQGLQSKQLPALNLETIDGLTFYPDKAEQHDQLNNNQLFGLRGEKVAMRPNKIGSYTLPEIVIPWWDTKTDKIRYATLAAETIEVIAADPIANISPSPIVPIAKPMTTSSPVITSTNPTNNLWFIISLICAAGWSLTIGLWVIRERSKKRRVPIKTQTTLKNRPALKQLKKACENNNSLQTREALLNWAKIQYPDQRLHNLQQLAQYIDKTDFYQQIQLLQQQLYASDKQPWSGAEAWAIFNRVLKPATKPKTATQALKTLYPANI